MSVSPETFFDAFRNDYPNSVVGESDKLPFNVGRLLLTEDELEGECTDWCVQFLGTRYRIRCCTTVDMRVLEGVFIHVQKTICIGFCVAYCVLLKAVNCRQGSVVAGH